jgi:hypothetical protein
MDLKNIHSNKNIYYDNKNSIIILFDFITISTFHNFKVIKFPSEKKYLFIIKKSIKK